MMWMGAVVAYFKLLLYLLGGAGKDYTKPMQDNQCPGRNCNWARLSLQNSEEFDRGLL